MSTSNEVVVAVSPPPPSPEQYWLSRIPWQLFGTLTFEEDHLPEAERLRRFFRVARRAAKLTRSHFPGVLWVLRQEDGDKFGHRHLHFVMAGLRVVADVEQLCAKLEECWQRDGGWKQVARHRHCAKLGESKQRKSGGRCQIEAYDPSRDGVGYLLKGLNYRAANFPTSAKFTQGNGQIMESEAVHRFLMESQQKNEPSREHVAKSS